MSVEHAGSESFDGGELREAEAVFDRRVGAVLDDFGEGVLLRLRGAEGVGEQESRGDSQHFGELAQAHHSDLIDI